VVIVVVLALLSAGVFDTNNVMIFYWSAASGNVDHYDVYVSADGGDLYKVGSSTSYAMAFYYPVIGSQVVVRVRAVDNLGDPGPMSVASDPVWRVSRSMRGPRSE